MKRKSARPFSSTTLSPYKDKIAASFGTTPSPDLIIIDFAMPGMNGAEVAKTVRERRPDVPIVFASGYAETEKIESAAGNAILLRKPFRLNELQAVLADVLRTRNNRRLASLQFRLAIGT